MFRRIDPVAENQGRTLLFGFLVALSLLVMIADQVGLLRPAEQVVSTFLNPVENATYHLGQNVSNLSAFLDDLQKLRKENEDLRNQLAASKAHEAEIANLANQLDVKQRQEQFQNNPLYKGFTTVPADVINHDTTGQNQTITINKGSNDGLMRGKPVVVQPGYLVGRIEHVEATQAVVMLITDNSVAVDVTTQRYQDNKKVDILPAEGSAIGQWQTGGRITIFHLQSNADVKPGDWVFTSGFNGTFPPSLQVGTIEKVSKQVGQPEQQATLLPVADLTHLTQVLVITSW